MSRGPRIKVLHVITRLVRGGAQRVLIDLLRGLDRERFEVSLVAGEQTGREGSLWPEARGLGIETAALPALVREIAPLRDLRALRRLGRLLRERRPDIVHAHTSKAGLIGCAAARKAGVPGVVLAPHGHILGEDARIPGVPRRGLRRRVLALMARRSGRYADVVIAPNDSEREASIRLGLSTEEQAVTVPNGVDAERFRPGDRQGARALLGLSSADTVVGAVARLTVEKGIDLAVEAVAELAGVRLLVIGDGSQREALERLGEERGVAGRVTFLGLREGIEAILPALDAVVVPSRTEAHGLVAAEALCCEIPVVCSDVGGLRSLVDHERTGLRVPPGDPGALAASLKRLLDDRPWAERLARTGRRRIVEEYSLATMLERTTRVYMRLVEGRLDA